ncbi:hypothetical protein JTE90_004659 [Oedothorax gibbosus]|uniref:Uncharacterized protein n=1 Tax=Oedothorax gibbosus TaxID=931172 RepID=A0AAV6UXH7_9ARAC|nr:hypothetical protein JTE90_004659 [Oedothorax gibbosus]
METDIYPLSVSRQYIKFLIHQMRTSNSPKITFRKGFQPDPLCSILVKSFHPCVERPRDSGPKHLVSESKESGAVCNHGLAFVVLPQWVGKETPQTKNCNQKTPGTIRKALYSSLTCLPFMGVCCIPIPGD